MSDSQTSKKFFGHPIQLSSLFHIELWERFSFYGMQGILTLYLYYEMTKGGLGLDKALAGSIVGAYGGSVYLSTILGGWLADRVWGAEKTLFNAGVVVMLGHILLALVPGMAGLFMGLVCIALGSGGVKASASSMVGSLYESEELRPLRDAGFSIFYISINIGGFLGPLITGLLHKEYGFHYGFGAAAIGMALGLACYSFGRRNLPHTPAPHPLNRGEGRRVGVAALAVIAVLVYFIKTGGLTLDNFGKVLLWVVSALTVGYFLRLLSSKDMSAENKRQVGAYIPMFAAICVFWAVWYQVYTVLTFYFEGTVNRVLPAFGNFEVPVPWKDSLQALWVIVFSGVLAALWTKLGDRQPKTPMKFALAILLAGLTYLCFIPFLTSGTPMPIVLFGLVLLILTLGELLLSPISLSFVTKIAPPMFKTQMVALNFLALSLGFTLGGQLSHKYFDEADPVSYYWLLFGISMLTAGILLLLRPLLNKLLQGAD
ncbi:MAG: oligopeptide:H+ symporter [Neisseria sp.]|nr:oligopeptide:H+ symporter [Neisseria sp.]